MYQRAMKVACIMNETEIENRENGQAKRKFGPGGSSSQGNMNFKKFRPRVGQNKGKKPPNENKEKHVTSVGVNTLAHAEALRANVSNVVIWITRSPIAQRPHGITRATLRDLE